MPSDAAVARLELVGIRRWARGVIEPAPGLTVITGPNGAGKTTVLEAVRYLSTRRSLRAVPVAGMVSSGSGQGVIRAEARSGERNLLFEAQLVEEGRDRFQVNRQPLRRAEELVGLLPTSVFAPDDLELVKGSPSERRGWLDELVVSLHPRATRLLSDLERVVRQRSALLRELAPTRIDRVRGDEAVTLEVFDAKLAELGSAVADVRAEVVAGVEGEVRRAARDLAGRDDGVSLVYAPSWGDRPLAEAIIDARVDELRRGTTLVGPQRDDVELGVRGLPARTHASQGEQRTLALALRLGAHRHRASELGTTPVLLLDDVLSELDPQRAEALLAHLPAGQVLLTTASEPPVTASPELVLTVADGALAEVRRDPAA